MPVTWGHKTGQGALRLYSRFWGELDAFSSDERLRITIDRDRNGKFNALFHVMLSLLVEAINKGQHHTTIDKLKQWIKIKNGYYDIVKLPSTTKEGLEYAVALKSTRFAAMGDEEFHRFCMDACQLIRDELASYISDAPEWREAMKIINTIRPEDV